MSVNTYIYTNTYLVNLSWMLFKSSVAKKIFNADIAGQIFQRSQNHGQDRYKKWLNEWVNLIKIIKMWNKNGTVKDPIENICL